MDLCDPFAKEGNDCHATFLLCQGEKGVYVARVCTLFFHASFYSAYAHVLPVATETATERANAIAACKSAKCNRSLAVFI